MTDGQGRPVSAPGLAAWLAGVAPARARGDIGIALVSDARIRALNQQFRRTDQPTDVLSFPSADPRSSPRRRQAASAGQARVTPHLGDIVIASGVARRQALEAGHSYAAELKVLALHGLLHLLGYDHHEAADTGGMARLERRLRAKGGLRAGLIERARVTSSGHAGRHKRT